MVASVADITIRRPIVVTVFVPARSLEIPKDRYDYDNAKCGCDDLGDAHLGNCPNEPQKSAVLLTQPKNFSTL